MSTLVEAPGKRVRRRHSAQFKASVVLACQRPGVSLASVALANGLNATMLRKWVVDSKRSAMLRTLSQDSGTGSNQSKGKPEFIALALPQGESPAPAIIHLEIERAGVLVRVKLPAGALSECASGLRELLL
jgi:transposase